ncbi:MAG: hypothetical protein PHC98_00210 [Syntrophotalea acetylenica]|nr:hypothetical protein [Syntrophotalea acetylenica]
MIDTKNIALHHNMPDTHPEQKTVVVLGVSRGGTSMVSGSLIELGVFMGENISGGGSYEDVDFFTKDTKELRALVARRDSMHDTWGWKYPHTSEYIAKIAKDLRNPYFVVIFRNIFDVARSFVKHHNEMPFENALENAYSRYNSVVQFVTKHKYPTMFFSFEKALDKKEEFLDSLVSFLDLSPNADQRTNASRFINKEEGYVTILPSERQGLTLDPCDQEEADAMETRELEFKLEAQDNVQPTGTDGEFTSLNVDPLFIYAIKDMGEAPNALLISYDFHCDDDGTETRFYVGRDGVFRQPLSLTHKSTNGKNVVKIHSPWSFVGLRLDPVDKEVPFSLRNLTIKKAV